MPTLDDVEEYGRNYGTYVSMCCPYHDDSNPSLLAYADGFVCLSCNKRGTLDELLRTLQGKPPAKPRWSKVPWRRWLDGRSYEELAHDAHQTLLDFPGQRIYLKERKILFAIEPLLLGWIDGYYTFPICDPEGKVVGLIVRAGNRENANDLRYCTPPDMEPCLYVPEWKRIETTRVIYVPFGIIDCIDLWGMGYPTLTWSNGKSFPPEALQGIRKKFVIVPDAGEEKSAYALARGLGWRGSVKCIDYPAGCKDPDDIYRKYGKLLLYEALA